MDIGETTDGSWNPNYAVHPGVLIAEHMESRGMDVGQAAFACRIFDDAFQELLNGERGITPFFAARLEEVFGVKAEIWLGMQARWDSQVEKSLGIKLIRMGGYPFDKPILVWQSGAWNPAHWTNFNGSHSGIIVQAVLIDGKWEAGENTYAEPRPEWWMPMPVGPGGQSIARIS